MMTSHSSEAPQITPQTTLAGLEDWARSVREWPCKPSSISLVYMGALKQWTATICMIGGPIVGAGPDVVSAVADLMAKVPR